MNIIQYSKYEVCQLSLWSSYVYIYVYSCSFAVLLTSFLTLFCAFAACLPPSPSPLPSSCLHGGVTAHKCSLQLPSFLWPKQFIIHPGGQRPDPIQHTLWYDLIVCEVAWIPAWNSRNLRLNILLYCLREQGLAARANRNSHGLLSCLPPWLHPVPVLGSHLISNYYITSFIRQEENGY